MARYLTSFVDRKEGIWLRLREVFEYDRKGFICYPPRVRRPLCFLITSVETEQKSELHLCILKWGKGILPNPLKDQALDFRKFFVVTGSQISEPQLESLNQRSGRDPRFRILDELRLSQPSELP